ncbi:DEAD/DEAH box [Colletotrichum chrysophilum]|uniref:DEAD/DEAH box n=1 Tax=Colletotrichum chrysophilum TaxID=1836956 RepID=A0AAD9AWJ9_9PEZI|nr:DEAD/DEAH box [Colletotrichum chrysophilum]
MADNPQSGSPKSDPIDAKEDAETAAARKELKHTAISEKSEGATGATTPQLSAGDEQKEQVSSPKKKQKRAHDQLDDEDRDAEEADSKSVASSDSAKDRASRLEPEKKRHRDGVTVDAAADSSVTSPVTAETKTPNSISTTTEATSAAAENSAKEEKQGTSAAAFASSGFAKLAASSASPFGSLGDSTKGSVFGGSTSSASPFGSLSPSKPAAAPIAAPTLSFGGAGAASSPFASVKTAGANGFGSAFGSGFGSALSGKPLTSFAKAGESSFKSEKPAKPFGAPESDVEDGSGDDADGDDGSASESGDKEEKEESDKEESKAGDDKKRTKLQKITVDDGEAGEATIIQVRAKMFYLEKEVGWKERGSGMLKINVPEACVSFDDSGLPIPGSFDASGLENDEDPEAGNGTAHKVARLIMRQDQTHRILLNTVILPAMKFQEKTSLKSVGVMFTAFEGEEAKPVSVHMRMSAASAKSFLSEVGMLMASRAEAALGSSKSVAMQSGTEAVVQKARGKRKRKDNQGGIADSRKGEDSSAGGQLGNDDTSDSQKSTNARKRTAPKKTASALNRTESAASSVTCNVDWPDSFKALEKTHRALNLVFTFCCTRKHLATTFETIRSAVESHTKKVLTIEDVASIAAVRPEGVNFAYVDEIMLQTEVRGAERDVTFKAGRDFRSQAPAPDASVGGISGLEKLDQHPDERVEGGKEVLYFEFVDGDLKRQVKDKKTGEITKPNRKLREETLKIPVYSQKQMTNLIERRNQKFIDAMNVFINQCISDNLDPEQALSKAAEAFIPVPTAPEDPPEKSLGALPESIPTERKSIPEIVQELKDSPWYTGQIVPDGHRVFEPQEAVYGDLNFLLSQDLVNALYNAKGITQFFAHQAEAINGLLEGQHVVVATSTSSGKSLIYQLPVIHALEKDYHTRAMYIFPTKALAQDQKRSLREMLSYMPGMEDVLVETFDGDTPMKERNAIRDEARIIFTNPDMLHITILPQEERWRTFLKNLKYVVVDELHYYNGQMGSHVSFIMRRLRRICAAVGNRHVKFISCSATVANPKQHFKTIFGRKEFLCWNTPYRDPGDPASGRGDAMFECARLFCQLMLRGVRIIAFTRVREQCEKLVTAVQQELESIGRPECVNRVMGYRGGYTAQDRRRIESEMFEGKLLGIVATTALELGIDIGTLDCVLTWGFPYTIANLRQQSGRAGRRNKDSLSVLVGDCFPTDQHYMQNPDELFTKPNCELQVDLENMLVREGHIQCAAYEMPVRPVEDAEYFGQDLPQICEERLLRDAMGFYHCHDRFRPIPSRFVAIRDTEDDHFAIIDITHGKNEVLEELEASRATFTIYDGAIFLHQGSKYLVRDFQPDRMMARVERVKVEWTTTQRDFTDIDPIETEAIRRISGSLSKAFYGTIKIQQNVYGFFKVDKKKRVLDAVHVDNPPVIRYGKGMWLDIPKKALQILADRRLHIAASIHAAEHAILSLMPNFVISLPGDVRTECKVALKEFAKKESQRKRPGRLTFYDAKGGASGSGISTKAFEHIDHLLQQALKRVEECYCESGCIECVASELCKENDVMSKAGSQVILKAILNMEIDVEALPMGPEEQCPAGLETVIVAQPVPPKDRNNLRLIDIKEEEFEDQDTVLWEDAEVWTGDE